MNQARFCIRPQCVLSHDIRVASAADFSVSVWLRAGMFGSSNQTQLRIVELLLFLNAQFFIECVISIFFEFRSPGTNFILHFFFNSFNNLSPTRS